MFSHIQYVLITFLFLQPVCSTSTSIADWMRTYQTADQDNLFPDTQTTFSPTQLAHLGAPIISTQSSRIVSITLAPPSGISTSQQVPLVMPSVPSTSRTPETQIRPTRSQSAPTPDLYQSLDTPQFDPVDTPNQSLEDPKDSSLTSLLGKLEPPEDPQ